MLGSRTVWKLLVIRALIAAPFLTVSLILFFSINGLGLIEALGTGLIAGSLLVVPAVLMADPISELISGPMGSFYHPEEKRSSPALMFSQPEACIIREKYDEAMQLLQGMIEIDPARAQVYIRIIDLALRHQGDHLVASDAFRLGMRNLEDTEKRNYLAEEYHRLLLLFPEDSRDVKKQPDDERKLRKGGGAFGWSRKRGAGNPKT